MRSLNEVVANEYLSCISEFDAFSPTNAQVVFLGDSITKNMRTNDMFEIRTFNRGIGGDTVKGVLARLDRITQMDPKKLFVLVGINSIAGGFEMWGADGLCDQYYQLFEAIRSEMPDTEVFIQSVLPINAEYRPDLSNTVICNVNLLLDMLSERFGFYYIDLYPSFLDETSNFSKDYTNDGIHLSINGSGLWRELMKPYVDGGEYPERETAAPETGKMVMGETDNAPALPYERIDIGADGSCAELYWTYDAEGAVVGQTSLAQIRDGKLIGIYDVFPAFGILSVGSGNTAMALINAADMEANDEFALCEINGNTLTAEGVLYPADE